MKKEILVIEDDPLYRNSIKRVLCEGNYIFFEASSIQEALHRLQEQPNIKVVLLDLSLSGGDGKEFLEAIKGYSSRYRIVILTAHDELLSAEIAKALNIFSYLPKTERFSIQSLRFTMEQAFKDIERELLSKKNYFLFQIQEKIRSNHDLHEILDYICECLLELTGAYSCHLRLYDPKTGDYPLMSLRSPIDNLAGAFNKVKRIGQFYSGLLAKTKAPVVLNNLHNEDINSMVGYDFGEEMPKSVRRYLKTIQAIYAVPISTGIFGAEVDAIVSVSSNSKNFFSEERRELIDDFATLVNIAITKDWLQLRRIETHFDYSRISKMLGEVSTKLKSLDNPREICKIVTQRISEIINAEIVSVFLFNERSGFLENVAEFPAIEKNINPEEMYAPGQSLTRSVYEHAQPIRLPNSQLTEYKKPTEDIRYNAENQGTFLARIPSGRLEHYLGVPIIIGAEIIGVLRAINKKSNYYDDTSDKGSKMCLLDRGFNIDSEIVLEIAASHLAVALHNAELVSKLNNQVAQLEALNSVSQIINSEININDLLQLTIRQTAAIMQAEICMLFLKDEARDRLILKQCYGMPMIEGAFYEVGEEETGLVALTGQSLLIEGVQEIIGKYDQQVYKFLQQKYGPSKTIESLMIVPIKAKGKLVGVMKVINKLSDHKEYSMEDLRFFETLAGFVGIAIENAKIYDLTNRRLAIAERNATLSHLVRSVAHEINNTSGLIPANVQALRSILSEPSIQANDMLDVIEDSARQAVEFANEIAGFSAGRLGERKAININEAIKEAVTQTLPNLQKYDYFNEVSLEINLSEVPIICFIYEVPFIQVVRNIVINAYQAMGIKKSGKLIINSSKDEFVNTATVQFIDNGCGIKEEFVEKIFEPDFTTKSRGNGLGLWLVKNHLDRIGGQISVESLVGRGSTFTIRVPLNTIE